MKHIYSFVDETGQHTEGELFIVVVIVVEGDVNKLIELCEQAESKSHKRKDKWGRTKHKRRMAYLNLIFNNSHFQNNIRLRMFSNTRAYDDATKQAIVSALTPSIPSSGKYTSVVYVDGLSKKKAKEYKTYIRSQGIHVKQVRGRKDENEALIRLADAIAGFTLDAIQHGREDIYKLYRKALRRGYILNLDL